MIKLPRTIGLTLVGLLSACSDPLPADKLDYAGQWQSPNMSLSIGADSQVHYQRQEGTTTTSINANIQDFAGDDFIVGFGPFNTTFSVSMPPQQIDGTWQMEVDGVLLRKK